MASGPLHPCVQRSGVCWGRDIFWLLLSREVLDSVPWDARILAEVPSLLVDLSLTLAVSLLGVSRHALQWMRQLDVGWCALQTRDVQINHLALRSSSCSILHLHSSWKYASQIPRFLLCAIIIEFGAIMALWSLSVSLSLSQLPLFSGLRLKLLIPARLQPHFSEQGKQHGRPRVLFPLRGTVGSSISQHLFAPSHVTLHCALFFCDVLCFLKLRITGRLFRYRQLVQWRQTGRTDLICYGLFVFRQGPTLFLRVFPIVLLSGMCSLSTAASTCRGKVRPG